MVGRYQQDALIDYLNTPSNPYKATVVKRKSDPDRKLSVLQLAIDLSITHDMTVYDALYVSIATLHNTQLVTADKKAHR
jgi:hypothetical protein